MTDTANGRDEPDRLIETVLAALPEAGANPKDMVLLLAARLPEARALAVIRALLLAEAGLLATFSGDGPKDAAALRQAALDLAARAHEAEASGAALPVRMRDLPR
ncbi:hypothetical protein [Roseicyclus sp.]|uniref:hypothetical protein n=1 Tax=Roseicyclus sp. TaxID=1914329 RepID=UPI003FA0D400